MIAQVLQLCKRIYPVNTLAVIPVLQMHGKKLYKVMLRTWHTIVEMHCVVCMPQTKQGDPSIMIERKIHCLAGG